ncbi:MAG: glycosyltransferase family 2 protein [Calothrix sp. MO_167.B42]|nr:glycosyltransferase family 2 protein [Calothrix sp. MO_167.B42]
MPISQLIVFVTSIIWSLLAVVLLIICSFFLIECVAALLPSNISINSGKTKQDWQNIEVAVLVPAHNEELIIGKTINGIIPVLKPQDNLIVIADNCSDNTAAIARTLGATVIERHNLELRGKGYALDYGLKHMEKKPPDVVVIIDADCTVHTGAIETLSEHAITRGKPVQGTYLMTPPKNSQSSKDFIAQLSNIVTNLVRPCGLNNLGQPCSLTGTGMAFPWFVITQVNLASSHLVEDLKLGLDLNIAGYTPEFCQSAKVTAYFPQQLQASKSQKTRWEHGHLQAMGTYVPLLLKQAVQQKRFDLLISTLDLCIPPLSLLVFAWLAMMITSVLLSFAGMSLIPAMISAIAGFCFLTAILTAWAGFAAKKLPLSQLLTVPVYVIGKIPIYFNFLIKPQRTWVRTQRDYERETSTR